MKIVRLKWALPAISLLCIASCSTIKTTISTSKHLNSSNGMMIQTPLVAELDVESAEKVTIDLPVSKDDSKSGEADIRRNAVARALDSTNGDVLIEPRFTMKRDGKGHITNVSVTGYATKYASFRQMELRDTLLLDGINGRQKIVKAYNEPKDTTAVATTSTKSNIMQGLLKRKPKEAGAKLSKNRISASIGYSFLTPITEGVNGGSSLSASLGYGSRKFSYGAYFEKSSLTTNEGQKFSNKDIGAYLHYNLLSKKFSPYARLNVGYKISDELTYISPDYKNKKKLDYGAEFGVLYSPNGRNGLSLFASLNRMVYASDYNGAEYGRAEDFMHLNLGARYIIAF